MLKPNKDNKPIKPIASDDIAVIISQYNTLLTALQGLYTDCHNTSDRQLALEQELNDIKSLLVQILKAQKTIVDFEEKIFRKNLAT